MPRENRVQAVIGDIVLKVQSATFFEARLGTSGQPHLGQGRQ